MAPNSVKRTGPEQPARSKARYRVEPDFDKVQVIDTQRGLIEVWESRRLAEQSVGRLNHIDELEKALRAATYVLELTSPKSPKFVNSASLSEYDQQEIGRILNMCRTVLKGKEAT